MTRVTKIAFCFPGQGSLEAGMGRDDRGGRARGDGGLRRRQRGRPGSTSRTLLRLAARGARRDGGPAAGARRDEPRDARRDARARHRARLRGRPLGRRVRRAGARRRRSASPRQSRSFASGAWRWPRRRASTRARWRRSWASTTRSSRASAGGSSASGRRTTTAPARSSSPARTTAVDECCARGRGRGRAPSGQAQGLGRVPHPLVARAADRLRPAIDKVRFGEPMAPFMSTVTARIEAAPAHRARCSSTS